MVFSGGCLPTEEVATPGPPVLPDRPRNLKIVVTEGSSPGWY